MDEILCYSTFEDVIPKEVINQWEMIEFPYHHKCPIHDTFFSRDREPCWQCYNDYE
jgi:hypothetical protein